MATPRCSKTAARATICSPDPKFRFDPVKVDGRLKDGQKISLGGTELTVYSHPGHTRGSVSYGLTIAENGRNYRVLIANMGSD